MATPNTLLGNRTTRRQITIPASTDVGTSVRALLAAVGYAVGASCSFKILGTSADGTSRAALMLGGPLPGATAAGTDYSTHGQYVAAGADYQSEPSEVDLDSNIRAFSGAAFTANVVLVS